jgi:hypothetical protein
MSLRHNTGTRLVAWVRSHVLFLVAAGATLGLVVTIFVTTFRLYDERQAQLQAIRHVQVQFCEGGNELRQALRDYLRQTILIRPIPADADAATVAELEERNRSSQAALDRGDRVFAPRDCVALARTLTNPD